MVMWVNGKTKWKKYNYVLHILPINPEITTKLSLGVNVSYIIFDFQLFFYILLKGLSV